MGRISSQSRVIGIENSICCFVVVAASIWRQILIFVRLLRSNTAHIPQPRRSSVPSSASAVRIRHVPVVSWVKRPRETIVQSFPDCSSLFFIPIVIVETGQARRPDQLQLHSTYLLMFSPSLPFQLTIACVRVDSWKILSAGQNPIGSALRQQIETYLSLDTI